MAWHRAYRAFPLLVLIAATGCNGHEPLAPLFMVVGAPTSLTATALSFSQISLSWQDNSNSPNESGFEVHRSGTGPTGSFALIGTPGPQGTSYLDAGLTGLTQYCYKIRAFRTTGHKTTYSEFSAVACATTPRAPVPAAPSGVTAAPYYGYAFHVTWRDNSTDESGFRIERSASADGPWATLVTVDANTTSLYDYQVVLEQPACYRVFGYNSYGDSDPSNVACTAVPAAPSNLVASLSGTTVDLVWTNNSTVADGVEIQRSGEGEPWTVIANVDANTAVYHDAPPPDNAYTYFVRAMKNGGPSGNSNTAQVVVAISAPQAPADVNAVPAGSNGVSVYWTDASHNEEGFRVERSTDGGLSWVAAGNTGMNELSFGDYPVPSEQPVCYHVVAFNHVGESAPSISDCTTPPAGPTGLIATGLDAATIQLDWTDNSQVEEHYEVRGDDGYGNQWVVATLDPNTTTFQVTDYYAYYYYYAVRAVKDGGYSDFSDWVYAIPPSGVAAVRGSPPRVLHAPRQRKLTGR